MIEFLICIPNTALYNRLVSYNFKGSKLRKCDSKVNQIERFQELKLDSIAVQFSRVAKGHDEL